MDNQQQVQQPQNNNNNVLLLVIVLMFGFFMVRGCSLRDLLMPRIVPDIHIPHIPHIPPVPNIIPPCPCPHPFPHPRRSKGDAKDAKDVEGDEDGSVTYNGVWHTYNRKLDGTLRAVVSCPKEGSYHGKFDGVWKGQKFDYEVDFSGPFERLTGVAQIDGANYQWTGSIDTNGVFKGKFDGDRYNGDFEMRDGK